ncbi:MAG TPA: GAF domain-containing protein [Polyangiaceae bacterium]|nr:GAF domain-containing protein [Polyangiaceae bacterium]
MAEDRRSSRSDAPGHDLSQERDQFLRTFSKGAQLTREFVEEYEALQRQLQSLQAENGRLRAAIEADDAIRDLLKKIEALEAEKRELLSHYRHVEEVTSDFNARFREMEDDFANLANLFVASSSLHSSLSPRAVTRRLKEVLEQLVGGEQFGVYLVGRDGRSLDPIATQGLPVDLPAPERLAEGMLVEVARSGVARIDDEADPSLGTLEKPPAVFPLQIDDNIVGVVAIFRSFAQKTRFTTVDFELFKLLGQHAAAALMSSGLYAQAERKLPGSEAFGDLSR